MGTVVSRFQLEAFFGRKQARFAAQQDSLACFQMLVLEAVPAV
jgi:hypothetical protein